MITPRQALLALVLATLGGAAWWWHDLLPPEESPPIARERRPDYVAEGIAATEMGVDGQVRRRLEAETLRHYADDGSSELDRPSLTLYTEGGPPWQATADTGWVSQDGRELRLRGNVVIDRRADADQHAVRIETEALQLRPREEYAETDLPVRLTSGADWVRSVGLRAWLGEPLRIELQGRTRAQFNIVDDPPE
ncbi:LPS export ABC transporter periplasmic protein LptC [Thiococcus pfennigii]|uniref:LPS export ABC transporter periplasmic protein LptC n=1 Tax=Thiococcus pfennigii TaxID=1057 RepID=UPI0019078E45|nr:LPS export ABC transporter periplasmic protein LptC [Thiococcus pfennigii]MBK1731578.1 LPS export ABC transporter periplasmic protein LptC [Thiococcus pfennigii]